MLNIFRLAFAFSGATLTAQVFPMAPQVDQTWDPPKLITFSHAGEMNPPSAYSEVRIQQPGFKDRTWKSPQGIADIHYKNQWFYGTKRRKVGATWRLDYLQSSDGKTWHPLAYCEVGKAFPVGQICLIDRRFFLLRANAFGEFTLGSQRSKMALAKAADSGELRITALVDMGAPPQKRGAGPAEPYGALGIFAPRILHLSDGLAVLAERNGYVWRLREGEGVSVTLSKVFPSVDLALAKGEPIDPVLLGCSVGADGGFVLASRSEAAVLLGPGRRKDLVGPSKDSYALPKGLSDAEIGRFLRAQDPSEAKLLAEHPEILWWEMTETGKLQRREAPGAWGEKLPSLKDLRAFSFHQDLKGVIHPGSPK